MPCPPVLLCDAGPYVRRAEGARRCMTSGVVGGTVENYIRLCSVKRRGQHLGPGQIGPRATKGDGVVAQPATERAPELSLAAEDEVFHEAPRLLKEFEGSHVRAR